MWGTWAIPCLVSRLLPGAGGRLGLSLPAGSGSRSLPTPLPGDGCAGRGPGRERRGTSRAALRVRPHVGSGADDFSSFRPVFGKGHYFSMRSQLLICKCRPQRLLVCKPLRLLTRKYSGLLPSDLPPAGLSPTLILTSIAGPWPRGVNAQATAINSKVLRWRKNITIREAGCLEGLQRESKFCCQPCPPGTRKEGDCKSEEGESECVPCQEGKEYTDQEHFSYKCRRCGICDRQLGFEVERNCTRTHNTKCRCKPNFFCNISECGHCTPCTTCEHGILENCTPTSNTKCREGSSSKFLWFFALIPIVISALCWLGFPKSGQCCLLGVLVTLSFSEFLLPSPTSRSARVCSHRLPTRLRPESDRNVFDLPGKLRRRRNKKNEDPGFIASTTEMMPINYADIDLSKYITSIVEQMTITQVREFVRKNGINEAKIDEIKNDNLQDTAEQKVQLLRNWYQLHGRRDAYCNLIRGLRKANLCALAERIQEMIQRDITS
ncbi:PREDICTED: tumor necrosis factor receptor superfamily member 6 [Odobenus rosmarus divergens]|uniref:Tumor necrosis factor receptor superfamily member 6 n=1 Tax=Odobenus rosmarus divergens TaxID=9708 RepID=A0A9B0H2Z8_ODORO